MTQLDSFSHNSSRLALIVEYLRTKMSVNSEYASAVLANIAKLNNEVEKVTLIAGRDLKR